MSGHVNHMGFVLELAAVKIVRALRWVPTAEREQIIVHLAPKKLQDAVREMME